MVILRRDFSLFLVILLLAIAFPACQRRERTEKSVPTEYTEIVKAFFTGVAALQAGDDERATASFKRTTELAPEEPAGWANLALISLRHQDFAAAATQLERAQKLAPANSRLYLLSGLLESNRGNFAEAVSYFRQAVEREPESLKALYALATELERQNTGAALTESQELLRRIVALDPTNVPVIIDLARLASKRGDSGLAQVINQLRGHAESWPDEAQQQLSLLAEAANRNDAGEVARRIAFLRNVLLRVPEFRRSLNSVKTPAEEIGEPFTTFLSLRSPTAEPAPPDLSVSFSGEPVTQFANRKLNWAGTILLQDATQPVLLVADNQQVEIAGGPSLEFPGGAAGPAQNGVLVLDLNYDFRSDLVFAGETGVRIFQQETSGGFKDVTSLAALPKSVASAAYSGAWVADIEMDGDLDIVLGALTGATLVLRNNGDGTFKPLSIFGTVNSLRQFCWGDIDEDGDPDAVLLSSQGELTVLTNERSGDFRVRQSPPAAGKSLALQISDLEGNGQLDIIELSDSSLRRISSTSRGDWEVTELTHSGMNFQQFAGREVQLFSADLDNNGALDLVIASPEKAQVLLADQKHALSPLANNIEAQIFAIEDLSGDGKLDLVGLSPAGMPLRLRNKATQNYRWQIIRPRAKQAVGDQRINSFGIGGEMEIRAGLLFQKQPISRPLVHFGLGQQNEANVVRIIWPNGVVQAEFDLQPDQAVLAEQRLKGSCPSLFAYDGSGMHFVKDCAPWSSAIGLRINAQDVAGIVQTEEWVKIRGDQLVAKEGFYDLRITAELWESYYVDHYSLLVVDHPADSEIFVDERCSIYPLKLGVTTVYLPRAFTKVHDDLKTDVTEIVRNLDHRYLDSFGRGQYQGVTRDHFVELELPEDAPRDGPLWLIAHGSLHPTDASINVARGQANPKPPRSLSVEVLRQDGQWVEARTNLGFPAGKLKTILIDLTGMFAADGPRKLRLRTEMEIYWDKFEWAAGSSSGIKLQRLQLETAELRYRGFSMMEQTNSSAPEVPNYNRIAGTSQRWRDLEGYYTRFGDIRELLQAVDGRIVIVNAGDEMRFRFRSPAPPPPGWIRDFVFIGDGWIKDGDYNSRYSKTVLPLPSHDERLYTFLPSRLEEDPVYLRHQQDWELFHTRYVSPDRFRNALKE